MDWFVLAIGNGIAGEIGDKSQLLLFVLALRSRKPVATASGVLLAAVMAHLSAAGVGLFAATLLDPRLTRWIAGGTFLLAAAWAAWGRPAERFRVVTSYGAFLGSCLSYFLADLGDRSYVVTAALATQTDALGPVVFGGLIGEALINVPLVFLADMLSKRLAASDVRLGAACGAAGLALAATGVAIILCTSGAGAL
jgi:putative Ca2+/H+ antiporter (TMEM165/GDT1 family)